MTLVIDTRRIWTYVKEDPLYKNIEARATRAKRSVAMEVAWELEQYDNEHPSQEGTG
jgi:hypothetical protein